MFNIISLVAVGAGVAGLLHGVYRLIMRRKPPKFLVPLSAGVAMIVFHIWNEYSWYNRTAEMLPPSIEVVETLPVRQFWAPWTYIFPMVNRFVALDRANTHRNDKLPGYVLTSSMYIKRAEDTLLTNMLVNCDQRRWTAISDSTQFDSSGLPANAEWLDFDKESKFPEIACR